VGTKNTTFARNMESDAGKCVKGKKWDDRKHDLMKWEKFQEK
jgi:hypothetical protein